MTDIASNLTTFVEPEHGSFAGDEHITRLQAPYDDFIAAEGLPVCREIGVRDVRDLPLVDWPRMGGRGAFLQPLGTEELWGMYVVEIPPGGSLIPEHHLYEEVFYVVEGRGSTEVWIDDERNKSMFEWNSGSLFAVPLNSWHRLVNATRERALILVATTAPPLMNHFRNNDFIFGSDYQFRERYSGEQDFFDYKDTLWRDGRDGRAMMITSLIPDLVNSPLPLDNQRSSGYRRIQPYMANNTFFIFVGEHETGKYPKAHFHQPSPVLVCLRGEGYTYTWPRAYGPQPWANGHGDKVLRQDYVPGGIVSAAPGGGDWFHQHFGVGKEPLRLLVFGGLIRWGAMNPGVRPGEKYTSSNASLEAGGSSISYNEEDPHIREEFEAHLRQVGIESTMPDELYRTTDRGWV
jgi:quercetin dioxygenase-like cupin family protein